MRASEFLIETNISVKDFTRSMDVKDEETGKKIGVAALKGFYWRNLLTWIKSGDPIETNKGTVQLSNRKKIYDDLRSIWSGDKPATPEEYNNILNYKLKTVDKQLIPIGQIVKTDRIKKPELKPGETQKSKDDGPLTKNWNIGNVIEGILGGAVTAKFKSPDKEITINDIKKVLGSLKQNVKVVIKPNSKVKITPMILKSNAGGNTLTFTMSLNAGDFNTLMLSIHDPEKLTVYNNYEEIEQSYKDAATYVNTATTILTALERVKSKGKKNDIIVESEGGSAEKQSTTKADLFITIDGKKERLLSLKAGSIPQIGQASGHKFENVSKFFKTTLGINLNPNLSTYFPEGTFEEVGKKIWDKGLKISYEQVYSVLQSALNKNDNQYAEYNLINSVYKGILHHATLGEDVVIVYLSPSAKKAYVELKMGPDLLEALQDFDLTVEKIIDPKAYKIIIYGVPKTDIAKEITGGKPQKLLQLRSRISGDKGLRNLVEVEKLLKSLTDIEKINERKDKLRLSKTQQSTASKIPASRKMADIPKPIDKKALSKTVKAIGTISAADKAAKDKIAKEKAKAALATGGSKTPPIKKGSISTTPKYV